MSYKSHYIGEGFNPWSPTASKERTAKIAKAAPKRVAKDMKRGHQAGVTYEVYDPRKHARLGGAVAVLAIALSACGGGGDSGAPFVPPVQKCETALSKPGGGVPSCLPIEEK